MVNFKSISDNLKNTRHWKKDLDELLEKQGIKRTNAIEYYICTSKEIWLSYKFRVNSNGNCEFYYINHQKNNYDIVERIRKSPFRFGQFGEIYAMQEPEKFVALAPVFYPAFFKWIEE